MKYLDGTDIRLGDRVHLSNGETGVIVISVDLGEFSDTFKKVDWEYLGSGVMVKTDNGALVHMTEPNQKDLVKIA